MTPETHRHALLEIVRRSIVAHVSGVSTVSADHSTECDVPWRTAGVFVTLHKDGELRGCIGHIEADAPLHRSVARCAVAACSSDPRFPPVSVDELSHVRIELSLLGPLEPISGPLDVEIGLH